MRHLLTGSQAGNLRSRLLKNDRGGRVLADRLDQRAENVDDLLGLGRVYQARLLRCSRHVETSLFLYRQKLCGESHCQFKTNLMDKGPAANGVAPRCIECTCIT